MRLISLCAWALVAGLSLLPAARGAGPDHSSPRATMLTNAAAGRNDDIVGLESCYYVSKTAEGPMRIYLSYQRAYMSLRRAVHGKFGNEGDRLFRPEALNTSEDTLAEALKAGTLKTEGDTATLVFRVATSATATNVPATTVRFKKVGAKWLIDADSVFNSDKPELAPALKKDMALIAALAGAVAEVTDQLNAGKYTTLAQVKMALEDKQAAAIRARAEATTAPAPPAPTAPASRPASTTSSARK